MASPTLKELKYRKFDDLINEVYIDFPSFTREGMVEPAQLIKIAQKCNYELGLKIHGTKETILEVEHGRAKLPSDFYILNLALLCGHYRHIEPGLFNGIQSENRVIPVQNPNSIPQLTSCPCWKVVNNTSAAVILSVVYCDNSTSDFSFVPGTTTICANSIIDRNHIMAEISTNSFCYNIPATGTYSCTIPEVPCCVPDGDGDDCGAINPDPWHQNRVFTQCNNTMQVNVIEYHSNQIREYSEFERIHMVPSKEATAFCVNTQFQDAPYHGHIRDGFLWVPELKSNHHIQNHTRRIYICYLGAMEDENGNLMVLDHPKINDYYEWAIKERILQNQYLNGEPDLLQRWQMANKELKLARIEALTITTTPDFYELKKTIEMNRRAMYHKYVHPFSSLYANTPGWPWGINTDRV